MATHKPLPPGDHWAMQYARMLRTRKRMNQDYTSTEEFDDAAYHFFQDAWSLKDWIKADPVLGAVITETDVAAVNDLEIAADIGNGTKHFELRSYRTGAKITDRTIKLHIGPKVRTEISFVIDLGAGGKVSAHDMADRVIAAWDALLRSKGVTPPK